MQELDTGLLREIDEADAQRAQRGERLADGGAPGPVFRVGEEIAIKGGRFRVKSFGRKIISFEGLPGTHIKPGE